MTISNSANTPLSLAGILFDKDGTLVDFAATWSPIIVEATTLAAGGDPVLTARLLTLGGFDPATATTRADSLFAASNTIEIVEAFVAAGASGPADRLVADFDTMFARASQSAVALADTRSIFLNLRERGLKLGIASSDNEASIRATARTLRVDDLVDFVAGYDSGHGVKPEPGMLLAFAEAIAVSPTAVAMVGDNRHDMAMARTAGAGLAVTVLSGTGTRDTLAPFSDVCLADIAALPAYLDSRVAG